MKLSSSVISSNLERLEKSKKDFMVLVQYENCNDFYMRMKLREEANQFNLSCYIDFIDFISESTRKRQEVFYRKKISIKEFQDILVRNAFDDDARKSFSTKSKKSFQHLINSDKWEIFSAERQVGRTRTRRYNNFSGSEAIIANFIIQNQLEIDPENWTRISKWYTQLLPEPENSLQNEIIQTKELIDHIVESMRSYEVDFRKLNFTYLTSKLQEEIKNQILKIETGEKIRCVDPSNLEKITYSAIYDVLEKRLENGIAGGGKILSVLISNDSGERMWYPYRHFETVTNMRDSFLDQILNS